MSQSVSLFDARPFFEKALAYGVQHGIIDQAKRDAICQDAPKGMVQIARYFGTEFLRPELEKSRDRIVNLVSLYLESTSGGDLQLAAESLRDFRPDSPTSPTVLGFMWNDFAVLADEPLFVADPNRAFVYGARATQFLLRSAGTNTRRVQAVFRGHQQSSAINPMRMNRRKCMGSSWVSPMRASERC